MNTEDYRRENMRRYIGANGGPTAVSKQLGYSNGSYLVQMTGPNPSRPITEKSARFFESKLGMEPGSLDREVPLAVLPKRSVRQQSVDVQQLAQVIDALTSACKNETADLPTAKFAEIPTLVAKDAAEHGGQVRPDFVTTLVRLAK